ncbi:alpha-ketoglutarate-dependent dioxygenase alkB homolog 7, mitochondrial-like isoform X1 [Xyrauchen texanus]|uniref:alpha-ketoglutarate-dependent dioxygenase alkB homolog 7, mitochondrial-like isoform X1 n=1 Tax=Xyrauchen texanus TaxID=154827 RepID=UPI0022420910|nr:alpha-ketoglutarate-dependent dioxygenase alkB homolog 7, mitochondrial-like isoform X1 [Xyrauchen texanus]
MRLLIRVAKEAQRKYFHRTSCYRFTSEGSTLRKGPVEECKWLCGSSQNILSAVREQVEVRQNFISEEEENALFKEVEKGLRKKRYEFDHWDDVGNTKNVFLAILHRLPFNLNRNRHNVNAIHGYRETERLQWGDVCESILRRVRAVAFPEGSPLLGPVHVLDLDKLGYIKPHIDSVKFCGSTIAGLSLLSDSVMRLVQENNSADWVDLLLNRRSLYILRDDARFKFTHEILKDEESFFSGQRVPRHRRISVICRNLPV